MPEKDLVVKKPDEMVKMKGTFSESELKLGTYLISILEQNKYTYKVRILDYIKKIDKKMKDFDYIHKVAVGLQRKTFQMVDREKKKFESFIFISYVKYEDGILEVEFSQRLHQYLIKIKDKFLLYNLQNIARLGSKYSIRLYELLKNEVEMRIRQKRELKFEINLEDLREMFSIPVSYKWTHIKDRILIPSQKELCKLTDICFDWQPVKIRKKVVGIIFTVSVKESEQNIKNIESMSEDSELKSLLEFIPAEYRSNGLINTVEKYLNSKGFDYVKAHIDFANNMPGVKNYPAFLKTALEEGYISDQDIEGKSLRKRIEEINDKYRKVLISEVEMTVGKAKIYFKEIKEIKENAIIVDTYVVMNKKIIPVEYDYEVKVDGETDFNKLNGLEKFLKSKMSKEK